MVKLNKYIYKKKEQIMTDIINRHFSYLESFKEYKERSQNRKYLPNVG